MKPTKTTLTLGILNRFQKKLSKKELAEARVYFDKISTVTFKTRVGRVEDARLLTGESKLAVRVYQPKEQSQTTVIFFHGGGWVFGGLDSHDEVARLLCKKTNSVVVSVDYRLAPEHSYPAPIEDGMTVALRLRELGVPTTGVFLAGDSAGGQVALGVAQKLKDVHYENLKGVVLAYPSVDPSLSSNSMQEFATKHFVTKQNMEYFWKSYLANEKYGWPLASKESEGLPPALIQVAEYDILRDEGLALASQLKAAGNKVESHVYKNSTHGMLQINSFLSNRSKALKDIGDYIGRYK